MRKMKENNRIIYLDTARVLSMLWIVAALHLMSSVEGQPVFTSKNSNCITVSALATFTFLSGFFLSSKVKNKNDVIPFYLRRLQRFYPLYFISCVSMLFARIISGNEAMMSIRQLILSLLGLATVVGPSPITLWYFSMLILFYLMTPFISLSDKHISNIIWLIAPLSLFAFSALVLNGDIRMIIYYPIYYISIVIGKSYKDEIIEAKVDKKYLLVDILLLCISILVYNSVDNKIYSILSQLTISLFSVPLVLYISKKISNRFICSIISVLSYSSLCVYLFHSQIYWVLEVLVGKFSWGFAYGVAVPSVLIIGWVIQKVYDRTIETIKKNRFKPFHNR